MIHFLRRGLNTGRQRYAPFSWSLFDFLLARQTSYKQVSTQLAESMLNGENMNNFTVLYTSYRCFTVATISTYTTPRAYMILVFFWLSSTNLYCFSSGSKMLQGLSIMCRLLKPVWVQFKCIHAGVIQPPIASSGCVTSTLRNST